MKKQRLSLVGIACGLSLIYCPVLAREAAKSNPDKILKKANKTGEAKYCPPEDTSKAERKPAVVAGSQVESTPAESVESEVKLKLQCPTTACQTAAQSEFFGLFQPKVKTKQIWLYDFADKRLKDKVSIRKRSDKHGTILTVKVKNVIPPGTSAVQAAAMLDSISKKFRLAESSVKGNKCEQDWNEIEKENSPYSCSLSVMVTPQLTGELTTPQNLLTAEQRSLIKEIEQVDLTHNTEAFPVPSFFEAEERELKSDPEVSSEVWYATDTKGVKSCYAFELSQKVAGADAAKADADLNDLVRSNAKSGPECAVQPAVNQLKTKSM